MHFMESHGTGTALGDPIEIGALEAWKNRCTVAAEICPNTSDAEVWLGAYSL